MQHKKAQVTIFIIIAVLIVAVALFSYFFIFRPPAIVIPSEIQPVEAYLVECVSEQVKDATRIAGLQGGYLEMPEFEPGSEQLPFSSQFDFLGIQVPYWFYVSGNNLARERKPSLKDIEKEFADYLKERVEECKFESFILQGYDIEVEGKPDIEVNIRANSIETLVNWPIDINYRDINVRIVEHRVSTKTSFGQLYDTANRIFDSEQEKLFLENYALDVLRLYAPTTDIELSCAPKTWFVSSVRDEVNSALEVNIAAVKVSGTYYELDRKEDEYFEVDVGESIDEQVYFLYFRNMPHVFEVWPSEDNLMEAEPIGTQPGLGILGTLGLCYVPYHFVYDLKFPVLVQVLRNGELFQFPVVVVIDKNSIRNMTAAETQEIVFDLCQHKTQEVTIFTYDENTQPIEAKLGFKCFNQICDLGRTRIEGSKAVLETRIPQCYNGFVVAKADGYVTKKAPSPGIQTFVMNVFMSPEHVLDLEVGGLGSGEHATVTFTSEDYSASVYYPDQKQIILAEGIYNVSVYLFKESSITLESQRVEKCIDVPVGGIGAIFGIMQEQCFELDVPQETYTDVIFGGGFVEFSITESELRGASKVSIIAPSYDVPKNLFDLGDVYGLIDVGEVRVSIK
ncbi:MAG: hypothetical protein IB618_03610 [Candidatus Pacearchaeota archaeon]|nr:MAG: hypothetical protein IB618_03610 [Candidatus Pacearchaeota archaeon]